jgi:hypothetical protein
MGDEFIHGGHVGAVVGDGHGSVWWLVAGEIASVFPEMQEFL